MICMGVDHYYDDEALIFMLPEDMPPEATMEPDELAASMLVGSYEFIKAGCPLSEPPESVLAA